MARQVAALPMTEAQFQRRVVELGKLFDWHVHHARPAMTGRGWRTPIQGHAGWPDLALAKRGRLVLAELKAEAGQVRPEQREWLAILGTVPGVEVYCWRPSDWPTVLRVIGDGRAQEATA